MKKKRSKYRKAWLLWVTMEGLVVTLAIMQSFLILRAIYLSQGDVPHITASAASYIASAIFFPVTVTLVLTTCLLVHKLNRLVEKLLDGFRTVAGGDYTVRLPVKRSQPLDDVYKDFNRMTEELQSVRTLREDFVNSYSHEFKTPITAIKGFGELVSEPDITGEERQQYLRIIQEESARLAELTNRTLLLTKLESQRFVPDRTAFSLDEQIRRCAILCAHRWEEKSLNFSAELEAVDYTGSEELLRQVWINLLNNAIRYTPPGGEIGVELKKEGREAAVRVWDTGAGSAASATAAISAGPNATTKPSFALMVKRRARLLAQNVSVEGCNTALASCTARLARSRVASAHGVSTMLRPARTRIGSPVTSRNLLNVRLMAAVLRFRRRAAPATLASLSNTSRATSKLKSGSDIILPPSTLR